MRGCVVDVANGTYLSRKRRSLSGGRVAWGEERDVSVRCKSRMNGGMSSWRRSSADPRNAFLSAFLVNVSFFLSLSLLFQTSPTTAALFLITDRHYITSDQVAHCS